MPDPATKAGEWGIGYSRRMANTRRPAPRPARRPNRLAAPAPEAPAPGLADVPPPLAYERTAAAAEDEGFDAATAAVFGAVVAVDLFCLVETERPGSRLGALVRAATLAQAALEQAGEGEETFTHHFAPRLPFDVVLGETGKLTAADLFLGRWGDELPADGRRAVKALLAATDTLVRATFQGKASTVEDLATGVALPGPARLRRGSRPFFCRLVKVGGVHVPLAVERLAGRDTVPTLLAELAAVTAVGKTAFASEGLRLRSPKKAFGLGAVLLAD
jgi:hypothetical protein